MERNYTRSELEIKKIPELKQILKNRELKATGKKEELIQRILDNQSQNIIPISQTYLDILPGDIKGMVGKYRLENDPNYKVVIALFDLLNDNDIRLRIKRGQFNSIDKIVKEINKIFDPYNIDVKYENNKLMIAGKIDYIPDDLILDFIVYLIDKRRYGSILNEIMEETNYPIRVIKSLNKQAESGHTTYIYDVGKFQSLRQLVSN